MGQMPKQVYIYNYSGTSLNIEATATSCTQTFNGVSNVCSYASNMPSDQKTIFYTKPSAAQTGLQAQVATGDGPAPVTFHPLETGAIQINAQTGDLEFVPGVPNRGGSVPVFETRAKKG